MKLTASIASDGTSKGQRWVGSDNTRITGYDAIELSVSRPTPKKTARQPHRSVQMPATSGPIVGPAANAIATTPMAKPRRSGGKSLKATICISGMKRPAARPCTKRTATRAWKFGANAPSKPTRNTRLAPRKMCLLWKRVVKNPLHGTMMPSDSMYEVVSHWPCSVDTSNSVRIDGKQVVIVSWLMMEMADAHTKLTSTAQRRDAESSGWNVMGAVRAASPVIDSFSFCPSTRMPSDTLPQNCQAAHDSA